MLISGARLNQLPVWPTDGPFCSDTSATPGSRVKGEKSASVAERLRSLLWVGRPAQTTPILRYPEGTRAASRRPGDVAAENDTVAEPLIGDQQQGPVRQRATVPLRSVCLRHQRRRATDAEAPLVLLPALFELAAQQQRLGQLEMRPGQ